MINKRPRINREGNTVALMIALYCLKHHYCKGMCPKCKELLDYALKRLDKCPFQEGKTTCARCSVHCYKPAMRERIRAVMRYSGPRMIYRHPILSIWHLIDGRRKEPASRLTIRWSRYIVIKVFIKIIFWWHCYRGNLPPRYWHHQRWWLRDGCLHCRWY